VTEGFGEYQKISTKNPLYPSPTTGEGGKIDKGVKG